MHRHVIVGLAVLISAMACLLFRSRSHPTSMGSTDHSSKRLRVSTIPEPETGSGFSGILRSASPPDDRRANILGLLADGEFSTAQTAISEWYTADPLAAEEWLEKQPSLAEFQPAISLIAKNIAESGYPLEALEWAKLLDDGPDREETLYEIYALGRRYNWLADEQLRSAPFPPRKIEALLSGAADD